METPIDPQDWILINEFDSSHNPKHFADAPIKPDHFSLDPINHPSDEEIDEGGVDSDNPSSPDESKRNLDASIESSTSFWLDSASEGGEEEVDQVSRGELGKDGILEGNGQRVWWMKATEVVRVWVLRVRPVWSISITAAVILGVAVMGRRLYRVRQKERKMALKIAIDDKKASQFMARAAYLNEAFYVVKRSPVIRPSLPAGSSISSWSTMATLR